MAAALQPHTAQVQGSVDYPKASLAIRKFVCHIMLAVSVMPHQCDHDQQRYSYCLLLQKYSRLRCFLHAKCSVICFWLIWQYSSVHTKCNKKVESKSWLLTCSSNIALNLPSYTGSAMKRELNFCNGYLRLLYFCGRH